MYQPQGKMLDKSLPNFPNTLSKRKKKTEGSENTDRVMNDITPNFHSIHRSNVFTNRPLNYH